MRLDLEIDRCTKKVKESSRALSNAKKDAAAHAKEVAELKKSLERLQAAKVKGRGVTWPSLSRAMNTGGCKRGTRSPLRTIMYCGCIVLDV
jgi:hypothetical protein